LRGFPIYPSLVKHQRFDIVVIGGGHAGAEAAWAAANAVGTPKSVALVTLDAAKIGVMSCNPAIGGLAKGQLVREIDALGGLMGLAADATGLQFRLLNTSKGPAVHGPRCQSDRHAYAAAVQSLIASRPEIVVIQGAVEGFVTEEFEGNRPSLTGVRVRTPAGDVELQTKAAVLTTGTFMRGLMHTGEDTASGGRHGEAATSAISESLLALGFELGRLRTGTPPRLRKDTIDWESLPEQIGDERPTPFSDLTGTDEWRELAKNRSLPINLDRFPAIEQLSCRQTHTTPEIHGLIRANLHRAPIHTGQIASSGPRYCPSIEDKVVRFASREQHGVFLEPESHTSDWVYCNGIATSLPADVQDQIIAGLPGCENAEIVQHGYAVEYDMVRPHQIHATGMTKLIDGLFLAGQINGTSGYEEAAAQGLIAGVNAARFARGDAAWVLGRDEAYLGVLMDDLVTKTPTEPYRMFTSRAEHRLILRSDNAADRLTPLAIEMGLLQTTELGRARARVFASRRERLGAVRAAVEATTLDGEPLSRCILRAEFGLEQLCAALPGVAAPEGVWKTVHAEGRYEPYIARGEAEIRRQAELERKRLPEAVEYASLPGLRTEAVIALSRFRPATYGQAGRLEGITPADLTLLAVHLHRRRAWPESAESATLMTGSPETEAPSSERPAS
jgi:tRNA uridine 5-carboxymethylaminomethyl modification enzyme